ncbi:sugar ABC transporter substrate-binding protein [Opitutales bacterium ASA1]|uniref:ABC transporter substrate-binding protein n=1 Tax=Congregicoccus parvus TaxID=3081749 RepID=UPI002B28AEB5|nr:sugar ABC transporter substrate-binding protein [Opitutales bacterium ASA1]
MTRVRNRAFSIFVACALALAGCRSAHEDETRLVRVWAHQGQEAENKAMREIAEAFDDAHRAFGVRVELTFFPDFQYAEKLAIAAAARDLPDAFDLDGPMVARLVDAGLLAPLDAWIDEETRGDFLPTILQQGTIEGRLYALGAFESAAVLYYDREKFERADVVAPPDLEGWTWDEFLEACAKLRTAGIEAVALHMDESADEWYTYAFSPVVWSAGGALVSPEGDDVQGVLASEANVRALESWQELFARGFAATDPVDPDPFGSGTVAMDWSGHWMARSHLEKFGDRLGVMPLPRVGPEAAAPCGSWCWGVSATSARTEDAVRWLKWVTHPEHGVAPIVRANGAVPARRSAFASFPEYRENPYALFRRQLETVARPRPRTPFYATLTQRFAAALRDIARGADVRSRLETAEAEVQRVVARRRVRDGGVDGSAEAVP